jgi:hypothetical protein
MGRPKGLRKDKATGQWYMSNDVVQASKQKIPVKEKVKKEKLPKPVAPKPPAELPAYQMPVVESTFKPSKGGYTRNQLVHIGSRPGLVLGMEKGKIVVQMIYENNVRQYVTEKEIN